MWRHRGAMLSAERSTEWFSVAEPWRVYPSCRIGFDWPPTAVPAADQGGAVGAGGMGRLRGEAAAWSGTGGRRGAQRAADVTEIRIPLLPTLRSTPACTVPTVRYGVDTTMCFSQVLRTVGTGYQRSVNVSNRAGGHACGVAAYPPYRCTSWEGGAVPLTGRTLGAPAEARLCRDRATACGLGIACWVSAAAAVWARQP